MDPPAFDPVFTKSAILDFINSQYPSSMGMRHNFSPAFVDATQSSSASSSLGVGSHACLSHPQSINANTF